MKRKVIQIANSTQLVSLPRKWSKEFNIKKGDELEITEQGNKILVSTEKEEDFLKTTLDVTNLDRSSIMYSIRGLYRKGYDEVMVKFDKPITSHYRMDKKRKIISVIHREVNRLLGFEVIQQKENFCLIKHISASDIKEFDTVLRRIFILLIDANKDLLAGAAEMDKVLLETIEEKHDTITKFVSYCLRMLNKKGHPDPKKTLFLYHIIASLDKITDIIKYAARDLLEFKHNLKKETIAILETIHRCIMIYYDLFYKFNMENMRLFSETKESIKGTIKKSSSKLPAEELTLVNYMQFITEILLDLTEARTSLEY